METTPPPAAAEARASGIALIAGGALYAVGNLLHPLQHEDAAYDKPFWELAHLVVLAAIPLLLLGLPALHRALRDRGAGGWSLAAAVLTVVGFIGITPGLLAEAFIAPEIGHAAMSELEDGGFGVVSGILGMAWVASLPALFFASRRAQLSRSFIRWMLVVAFTLLVGASGSTSAGAGVAIIAGTALYGVAMCALGVEIIRGSSSLASAGPRRSAALDIPVRVS